MRLTSDFEIPADDPMASTSSSTDTGRDPVDVGLHDDGVEGLVDASAGLEDGREEAAAAQLGDGQLHVAGLGGEHPRAVPVALVGAVIAALVAPGTDQGRHFGLDQLLADQADRFSDQIEPFARLEGGEQLGQDRLVKGHRCVLLWCVRTGTHRGSRRWPPYGWTLGLTSNPTTPGGTAPRARRARLTWILGVLSQSGCLMVAYARRYQD